MGFAKGQPYASSDLPDFAGELNKNARIKMPDRVRPYYHEADSLLHPVRSRLGAMSSGRRETNK
jgi:hypothetical protein